MLGRLFRKVAPSRPLDTARVPDGVRVYAIGDIHGRNDLLTALLAQIDADDRARGTADTRIVLLGDLVDRGPDSAGVIDTAMAMRGQGRTVHYLMGNQDRKSVV